MKQVRKITSDRQHRAAAALCRFFPTGNVPTKVTVCCGFFVDRVQQIQHLNQTVWAQVEELTYQQSQLFRSTFSVPKVSTMMEVGSATPIA
ncbi:Uncharacterised protein [Escherichia coli]|uniref:Uncharacterized protein n=1 Tax=Escherichia coli TaxID=562 RepID=A0A376UFK8_ECOLX|nr:Uncharacterised protein [Escherichia coli]